MSQLVVNNLRNRHARLIGEIESHKRQLRALKSELAAVDKMLRLLDAGIEPGQIKGIRKHTRHPGFKHGEMTRLCFMAMRETDKPMSCPDMAAFVCEVKGIESSPEITRRVWCSMMRLAKRGQVIRSGAHRRRLWALAWD